MIKVLIKRLNQKVKIPSYKTIGSSGVDLEAFLENPIDLSDILFATIQSQFFSSNFFKELLTKSLVSAANPIVNFGLNELCLEILASISIFFIFFLNFKI